MEFGSDFLKTAHWTQALLKILSMSPKKIDGLSIILKIWLDLIRCVRFFEKKTENKRTIFTYFLFDVDFPGILMIILSDNCQKVKYHHIYYARHPNRRRILGQFEETSLNYDGDRLLLLIWKTVKWRPKYSTKISFWFGSSTNFDLKQTWRIRHIETTKRKYAKRVNHITQRREEAFIHLANIIV